MTDFMKIILKKINDMIFNIIIRYGFKQAQHFNLQGKNKEMRATTFLCAF